MSLQPRRERYILLHNMWKILNGAVSNNLRIQFVSRSRTGFKAVVPPLRSGASTYHQSLYDNFFAVSGPRLWNCISASINQIKEFHSFKSQITSMLFRIPDKPPVPGYTCPLPKHQLLTGMENGSYYIGTFERLKELMNLLQRTKLDISNISKKVLNLMIYG